MQGLNLFLETLAQGDDKNTIFRIVENGRIKKVTSKDVRGWLIEIGRQQMIEKTATQLVMANPQDAKEAYLKLVSLVGPQKEQKHAA
ncbi:hypothetical protein [Pseudodesulfovibrio pelocollis]|uniref:hypothetical protein n=1 Tax=Pseudodesulfovibrio pelocollis TaxID=3051432 RepID=UPI00255B11C9|nr:hypothetical protein [Pseudodesulfovibrio sp. SB368]